MPVHATTVNLQELGATRIKKKKNIISYKSNSQDAAMVKVQSLLISILALTLKVFYLLSK